MATWTPEAIRQDADRYSSRDEVSGNRDLVGHRLDTMGGWASTAARETRRLAIDQQHSSPDAIDLGTFESAGETRRVQRALSTDRFRPRDVEIVV